jgi:hypothetical protein
MTHYCKTCAHFRCEVMRGNGEPLEDRGECFRSKTACKHVDADDWCNQFTVAKWAKEAKP